MLILDARFEEAFATNDPAAFNHALAALLARKASAGSRGNGTWPREPVQIPVARGKSGLCNSPCGASIARCSPQCATRKFARRNASGTIPRFLIACSNPVSDSKAGLPISAVPARSCAHHMCDLQARTTPPRTRGRPEGRGIHAGPGSRGRAAHLHRCPSPRRRVDRW